MQQAFTWIGGKVEREVGNGWAARHVVGIAKGLLRADGNVHKEISGAIGSGAAAVERRIGCGRAECHATDGCCEAPIAHGGCRAVFACAIGTGGTRIGHGFVGQSPTCTDIVVDTVHEPVGWVNVGVGVHEYGILRDLRLGEEGGLLNDRGYRGDAGWEYDNDETCVAGGASTATGTTRTAIPGSSTSAVATIGCS